MIFNRNIYEVQEYFITLNKQFESFCQDQDKISAEFNTLKSQWSDEVCDNVADSLLDIGRVFKKAYTEFEAIYAHTKRQNEILADYNNSEWNVPMTICQLEVKINTGGAMAKGSINTDSEAVYQFEKALAQYIDKVDESISSISAAQSAANDFWNDKQYQNFSSEINDFIKQVDRELDALTDLWQEVNRKRIILQSSED
ncbi:MAG: hypothetical protein E7596_06080 [Ruminococcaceae bacterium]|nr:hypothetical protein [Oscillospiraceae bacterium]